MISLIISVYLQPFWYLAAILKRDVISSDVANVSSIITNDPLSICAIHK